MQFRNLATDQFSKAPQGEIRNKGIDGPEGNRNNAERCNACLWRSKPVTRFTPIHKAQLLSYMKLLDIPLGLIVNFNELKLTDGLSRLILSGSNMT